MNTFLIKNVLKFLIELAASQVSDARLPFDEWNGMEMELEINLH